MNFHIKQIKLLIGGLFLLVWLVGMLLRFKHNCN